VEQRNTRPVSRVYDPNGSNARVLEQHSWTIRYGDMSGASGQVFLDKVSIGDLTVPNQAVEAAASVSRTFTRDNKNDGLLGLAFSKLNTVKPNGQKTWFDNVRTQLSQPVFTAALKRRAVGTYDFGYIDKGKYKGDLVWTPISGTKGFWDFTPTGFQVGDKPVVDVNISAIADTGTSLWYLPKPVADAYWEAVPGATFSQGQQGYIFPCHEKLPDISLVIAGKKITVPGNNMNYQGISVTTCFGGIQRNDRMPFSIFGDTFLKGLFVAFEAPTDGPARIGFAQQPLS
jgi:aspergillopepsin I